MSKYYEQPNCLVCGFNNYDCNGKCTIPDKELYRCDCCGADRLREEDVIEMSNGIHFCKDCYEEQEGGEDGNEDDDDFIDDIPALL